MTFCWKCPTCGSTTETNTREGLPPICNHGDPTNYANNKSDYMVRDYKAESAGVDRWALKFWGTRHQRREPENP